MRQGTKLQIQYYFTHIKNHRGKMKGNINWTIPFFLLYILFTISHSKINMFLFRIRKSKMNLVQSKCIVQGRAKIQSGPSNTEAISIPPRQRSQTQAAGSVRWGWWAKTVSVLKVVGTLHHGGHMLHPMGQPFLLSSWSGRRQAQYCHIYGFFSREARNPAFEC